LRLISCSNPSSPRQAAAKAPQTHQGAAMSSRPSTTMVTTMGRIPSAGLGLNPSLARQMLLYRDFIKAVFLGVSSS